MADLTTEQRLDRLAQLLVGFGANVQPGQIAIVSGRLEDRELMRGLAARCYQAGALHVEVEYLDPHVQRAKILHGGDETIGYAPEWAMQRVRAISEQRCANLHVVGGNDPTVLAGLDPDRLGRDRSPAGKEWLKAVTERTVNWTIGPSPTPVWAAVVHPDLPPAEGLQRLWEEIERVCRLDEDDPVDAWRRRREELVTASDAISERHFDALHYEAPGTDFTVGLLPTAR